jgi:RNase P/RNase MRP subunit POP5
VKHLPPTLREDYRYLKFRIHSDRSSMELGAVVDAVWRAVLDYTGTRGAADINFWVIGNRYDAESAEGVVRVHRDYVNEFRAAICLLETIDNEDVILEILKSSGSLESLP